LKQALLQTDMKAVEMKCLSATVNKEDSWLWPYRFDHLNFRSLNHLVYKEIILGVPNLDTPYKVCDTCLIGKQPRDAFKSNTAHR